MRRASKVDANQAEVVAALMERAEGWCASMGPLRVASDVAFGFAARRAFLVPESVECRPA